VLPAAIHLSSSTTTSPPNHATLPASAFAGTSQAKLTTTNSYRINTLPANKTTTSNISSNSNNSIIRYCMYDPGSDRFKIEGTPACDRRLQQQSPFCTHCSQQQLL
jgi:hypothetical protein